MVALDEQREVISLAECRAEHHGDVFGRTLAGVGDFRPRDFDDDGAAVAAARRAKHRPGRVVRQHPDVDRGYRESAAEPLAAREIEVVDRRRPHPEELPQLPEQRPRRVPLCLAAEHRGPDQAVHTVRLQHLGARDFHTSANYRDRSLEDRCRPSQIQLHRRSVSPHEVNNLRPAATPGNANGTAAPILPERSPTATRNPFATRIAIVFGGIVTPLVFPQGGSVCSNCGVNCHEFLQALIMAIWVSSLSDRDLATWLEVFRERRRGKLFSSTRVRSAIPRGFLDHPACGWFVVSRLRHLRWWRHRASPPRPEQSWGISPQSTRDVCF